MTIEYSDKVRPLYKANIFEAIPIKPVAPGVTLEDVEAEIAFTTFFTAADGERGHDYKTRPSPEITERLGLLTFCVLVLRSGFTVTGESACVSPEKFDAAVGRKLARDKAIEKVWQLLGFRLCDERNEKIAKK